MAHHQVYVVDGSTHSGAKTLLSPVGAKARSLPSLNDDGNGGGMMATSPGGPKPSTNVFTAIYDKATKGEQRRESRASTCCSDTESRSRSHSKSSTEGGSDMGTGVGNATEASRVSGKTGGGTSVGKKGGGASRGGVSSGGSSAARRRRTAEELKTKAKAAKARMKFFFKPRRKVTTLFLLLEAIGIIIYYVMVMNASDQILKLDQDSVVELMPVLEFVSNMKINQVQKSYLSKASNSDVLDYLRTANQSLLDKVEKELEYELRSRQIEVSMLVDRNLVIVATGNYNKSVIGQVYNPWNVASLARQKYNSTGLRQLTRNALVEAEELHKHEAPKWCERVVLTNPALAGRHPFDTNEEGFIKYMTTVVVDPDDDTLLGFFVVGDLHTGKLSTAAAVYETQWHAESTPIEDGFVAAFLKQRSAHLSTATANSVSAQQWVSITKAGVVSIPTYEDATALIVEGKPFNVAAFAFMEEALTLADNYYKDYYITTRAEYVSRYRHLGTGYAFAAAHVNRLGYNEEDEAAGVEDVDAVLVRGVHSSGWIALRLYSWAFIIGMIIMEAITLLLVMTVFLSPLEEMGKRIRMGGKLDHKNMKKLLGRRNLMGGILLWDSCTLIVAVAMMVWAINLMNTTVIKRTRTDPGTSIMAFQTKVQQIRTGFYSRAQEAAVRNMAHSVLHGTSFSADDVEDVQTMLMSELTTRKIEIAALLDTDFRVIAMANHSMGDVNSTYLDPLRGSSTCVSQNDPTVRYGALSLRDFKTYFIPKWDEHLAFAESVTTPDSHLHPTQDNPKFLARVIVTPVYATGDDAHRYPAALLLAMDIVNGKTYMGERALELFSPRKDGYAGVYFYDEDVDEYQIALGIVMHDGENVETDYELTSEQKHALMDGAWSDPLSIGTISGVSIYGSRHYISASCVLNDFVQRDEAKEYIDLGRTGCPAFVMHSMPERVVAYEVDKLRLWEIMGLVVQIVKLISVVALCRFTYKPFKDIIVLSMQQKGKAGTYGNGTAVTGTTAGVGSNCTPAGCTTSLTTGNSIAGNSPSKPTGKQQTLSQRVIDAALRVPAMRIRAAMRAVVMAGGPHAAHNPPVSPDGGDFGSKGWDNLQQRQPQQQSQHETQPQKQVTYTTTGSKLGPPHDDTAVFPPPRDTHFTYHSTVTFRQQQENDHEEEETELAH